MNELDLSSWRSIDEEHLKVSPRVLEKFKLSDRSLSFLTELGMPCSMYEFNFDYLKKDLLTLSEMWDIESEGSTNFLCLGFNSCGDPLCLDMNTDKLIYLNHDDGFKSIFINSGLIEFALCAIQFEKFISLRTKFKSDSFFETEFSDLQFQNTKKTIAEIDPRVIEDLNSHWNLVLNYIMWERAEERKS